MNYIKLIFCFVFILFVGSGCILNPNLRTARVLNEGQLEVSTGIVVDKIGKSAPAVIGAYGVASGFEIEAKYVNEMGSVVPRLQVLYSEKHYVDLLISTEVGYGKDVGFYYEPGIMVGRRFSFMEPYLSYQYAKYRSLAVLYILAGNRFHFPSFSTPFAKKPVNCFLGVEGGPSICLLGSVTLQYGVNFGFTY